jgi:hypothetical protein
MRGPDSRKAALHRDGALRRLRRSTQVSVVVTLALGGAFAALAAGSTHAKKIVRAPVRRAMTTTAAALTSAPVPPLVAVEGASQAAPQPSPAPPAAAPAPTYQQPAVVSGGS